MCGWRGCRSSVCALCEVQGFLVWMGPGAETLCAGGAGCRVHAGVMRGTGAVCGWCRVHESCAGW
jgi:hypothetical protein